MKMKNKITNYGRLAVLAGALALGGGCGPWAKRSYDQTLYSGVISTNTYEYGQLIDQGVISTYRYRLEIMRKNESFDFFLDDNHNLRWFKHSKGKREENFNSYRNPREISMAQSKVQEYVATIQMKIDEKRDARLDRLKRELEGRE